MVQATTITEHENRPDTRLRRSTRQLQATPNADPALLERMRPGRVRPASNMSATVEDDEDDGDPTAAELRRESGLGSDDDDYEVPLRQQARRGQQDSIGVGMTQPTESQATSGEVRREHAANRVTSMSATIRELETPTQMRPGRFDRLLGPHLHSIPTPPAGTGIRNLINPAQVPAPLSRSSALPLMHDSPQHLLHIEPPSLSASTSTYPAGSPASGAFSSVGSKRSADVVSEPSDEDPASRRARKKEAANAARLRYKSYKYNAALYRVMRKAGDLLQVHFATQIPFPAPDEREDAVNQMFNKACEIFGQATDFYTLSDDDIKLLRIEDTNVRSRVKKAAATAVPKAYGLYAVPNAKQLHENRERVKSLLTGSAFHYEDPQEHEGRFQHPVIAEIIWDSFFSHANALGCLYQEDFGAIPHELLALTLTCIRHVLKLWETGRKVEKRFAASQYEVYDQYLQVLDQYDSGPMRRFWGLHRREVFKKGLEMSGCCLGDEESEAVVQQAAADELDRELVRMQERFGSVPMDFDDSCETQPHSSTPHDHSMPNSTSNTSNFAPAHCQVSELRGHGLDIFDPDYDTLDAHDKAALSEEDDTEDIEGAEDSDGAGIPAEPAAST
ncbi:hypothetical protein C2E23DRAFT_889541 [Lenzites betulinus]|nr:hypothetical protein C2E23DRAFT_889541 [Lenzites betulinus]